MLKHGAGFENEPCRVTQDNDMDKGGTTTVKKRKTIMERRAIGRPARIPLLRPPTDRLVAHPSYMPMLIHRISYLVTYPFVTYPCGEGDRPENVRSIHASCNVSRRPTRRRRSPKSERPRARRVRDGHDTPVVAMSIRLPCPPIVRSPPPAAGSGARVVRVAAGSGARVVRVAAGEGWAPSVCGTLRST